MARVGLSLFGLDMAAFANRRRLGLEMSFRFGESTVPLAGPVPMPAPEPAPAQVSDSEAGLRSEIASHVWYHTIDLGNGIRTPGYFDHAPILPKYRLPERLDGLRVLDVATFDGYWAFEFERRGAAEVIALDLPNAAALDLSVRRRAEMSAAELAKPFGAGFAIAARALQSRVQRLEANVYDLSPELHGTFDLVHIGDVLLHLRDPVHALERVRAVTRGRALISDCYWPELDRWPEQLGMTYERGIRENIWWRLGARTLEWMIRDAGFDHVSEVARFPYGIRGAGDSLSHIVFEARP